MIASRPLESKCPSCSSSNNDPLSGFRHKAFERAERLTFSECVMCDGTGLVKTEIAARFYATYNATASCGFVRSITIDAFLRGID